MINSSTSLPIPFFLFKNPNPIKTISETTTGDPTEIDNGTSMSFVRTNVNNPAKTEDTAAVSFEYLKTGNNPKTIGTEIGPISAPNHSITNLITPPKYSF